MKLHGLPFQKPEHTHLSKQNIKGRYTVAELPIAYHNLLNQTHNGGYTSPSMVLTKQPTKDSLNGLYVPYIAGLYTETPDQPYLIPNLLDQPSFRFNDAVSENEIIFYEDHDRVLTLNYADAPLSNMPRVDYYEFSTGRHFEVAPTFQAFLDQFEERYYQLPHPSLDSYHRANAAFIHCHSHQEYERLLDRYEGSHLSSEWLDLWQHTHKKAPTLS
ncbi:SMI1/KNR4 family protein [Aerococcus vaginalis]